LWVIAVVGFIVAAFGVMGGLPRWRSTFLGVTLFSLVLTALDWEVAYAGVIIGIIILAVLWIGPRIVNWFPQ
jgi:hypothetical protein